MFSKQWHSILKREIIWSWLPAIYAYCTANTKSSCFFFYLSDSDLDSIRNSCDVLWYNCLDFRTKTLWYTWHSFNGSTPYIADFCSTFRHAFLKVCQRWQWKMFKMREGQQLFLTQLVRTGTNREASITLFPFCNLWAFSICFAAYIIHFDNIFWEI